MSRSTLGHTLAWIGLALIPILARADELSATQKGQFVSPIVYSGTIVSFANGTLTFETKGGLKTFHPDESYITITLAPPAVTSVEPTKFNPAGYWTPDINVQAPMDIGVVKSSTAPKKEATYKTDNDVFITGKSTVKTTVKSDKAGVGPGKVVPIDRPRCRGQDSIVIKGWGMVKNGLVTSISGGVLKLKSVFQTTDTYPLRELASITLGETAGECKQ